MSDMMENLAIYGYLILFFYSLGGGFLALLAAGVMSYSGGLNIYISISVATLANFIGDLGLFWLGKYNKSQIMPYLKSHRRKLALAQLIFKKRGEWIIFIKKYIYIIRTIVPIALGMSKYGFTRFALICAPATIIWGIIIAFAGYFGGGVIINIYEKISIYPWMAPVVAIAIIGLVWAWLMIASKRSENGKTR